MLDKKTISLPFSLGLDQKTSDGTATPGALESTSNSWFDKAGQINKRKGFATQGNTVKYDADTSTGPSSGTISGGKNVYAHNEDLLIADGFNFYRSSADDTFQHGGALLNCSYSREKVAFSENKKAGQVRLARVLRNSAYYDVMVWVQAKPVKYPTYEICAAVRDVESGGFIRKPFTLDTIVTASGDDYEDNWKQATSIKLIKISETSLYVIYRDGNNIRYFEFPDFISAAMNTIVESTLLDSGGSSVVVSNYFNSLDAIHFNHSSSDHIIIVYATPGGTYKLSKYTASGGNLNHHSDGDVKLTLSPSVASTVPNKDVFLEGMTVPGISLVLIDTPLMSLTFTNTGTSINANLDTAVYSAFFNAINLNQSFDATTDADLHNRVLVNSSAYEFTSQDYDFLMTTTFAGSHDLTGSYVASTASHASGYYVDTSGIRHSGLKSQVITMSASTNEEGFAFIYPLNRYGQPAKVWANFTGSGSGGSLHLTVIESGSGFQVDSSNNLLGPEETNLVAWIKSQLSIGATLTIDPSVDVAANAFQEDDKAPLCTILRQRISLKSGSPASGGVTVVHENSCMITDIMLNAASVYPMFAAVKTNANFASFNSFEFISDAFGTVHAQAPTGDCSYSLTSEFKSIINQQLRLIDGLANVTFIGTGAGTTEWVYGSNSLINTFLGGSIGDSGLPTDKYLDQTFCPSVCVLDLEPDRSLPGVSAGSNFLIGAGTLFSYDGQRLVDNGFYEAPSFRSAEPAKVTANTSKLECPKTYFYAAVFEYTDANGNLHESVPSEIAEVATTVDGSSNPLLSAVHLRVNVCDANRKRGLTRLALYRTAPDGALLKKIASIDFALGDSVVDFMDLGEDDEFFTQAPALYTSGGILANFQPGSVTDLCTHRGRVVACTPSEFVRFSKVEQQGFCYSFPAPNFVIDLPADSRLVSGAESNPNFLVLFTESDVYAVQGDGPDNFGVGSFGKPQLVGKGQGAVKGSAHLAHAIGTFFQSHRGIYMVTPDGQLNYVGANVQDIVGSTVVKSMDLFDHVNEIRFLIFNASSGTGSVVVYNTLFQQWSDWNIKLAASGKNFVGQTFYLPPGGDPEKSHVILQSDGVPIRQSNTAYTDAGGDYDLSLKLRPIQAVGLQQAQRVYRSMLLYDYKSDSTLTMKFFTDYLSTAETHTISVTAISDIEQIRAHLANQKSKAIQAEVIVTSSGEGLILKGIAFQIGARAGTFKLPASQTA